MNGELPPKEGQQEGDRHGERDSQLSAMFDGELPAAECELLARRLGRDEALRAQWSRYALIGAALRAERGVALHDQVASRVQAAIAQEASYTDAPAEAAPGGASRAAAVRSAGSAAAGESRWMRVGRPFMGAGIAAAVAAVSILWLRGQDAPEALLANAPASESITLVPETDSVGPALALNSPGAASDPAIGGTGEPERYSTPAPSTQSSLGPPARLANYVVAHSEYSGPLSRRMALLGIVSNDAPAEGTEQPGTEGAATPEASDAP